MNGELVEEVGPEAEPLLGLYVVGAVRHRAVRILAVLEVAPRVAVLGGVPAEVVPACSELGPVGLLVVLGL